MRTFYLKKKGCEGVYGFPKIFRLSYRKNDGGNGDMEVPGREFEGVKRSCQMGK